jgi:hypothetical protein
LSIGLGGSAIAQTARRLAQRIEGAPQIDRAVPIEQVSTAIGDVARFIMPVLLIPPKAVLVELNMCVAAATSEMSAWAATAWPPAASILATLL